MNINTLKENLMNTIKYDFTGNNKQKIMNMIIDEKIGTYHPKKDPNSINLVNMEINEKIELCLNSNNKVIDFINKLEFSKGYRYSILLKYSNIDFSKFDTLYTNINGDYYNNYNNDFDSDEVLIKENTDMYLIKFHKFIKIIDKKNVQEKTIRYPIVIAIYKNINVLEIKFDKLSHDGDSNFYKLTMDARISRLVTDLNLIWEPFSLEETIKELDTTYSDLAKVIIWSFEAAQSKGLTLKVGEDGIMPFIGEIELLINSIRESYDNDEVNNALDEVLDYIDRTKKFANEKFRIISWKKRYNSNKNKFEDLDDNELNMKINFEYKESMHDLINIYEIEINDMERCNYVIKSICEIARRIGEL